MNDYKAVDKCQVQQRPSICYSLDILDKELEEVSNLLIQLGERLEPISGEIKSLVNGVSLKDEKITKSKMVIVTEELINRVQDLGHRVKYMTDRLEV